MRLMIFGIIAALVGALIAAAVFRATEQPPPPPPPPAKQESWLDRQQATAAEMLGYVRPPATPGSAASGPLQFDGAMAWAAPAAIVTAGAALGSRMGAAGIAIGAMGGLAVCAALGMFQDQTTPSPAEH